ncbi:MAG: hypothetical protein ACUVR0_10990 [Candidatus Aminicenantales bacterium]
MKLTLVSNRLPITVVEEKQQVKFRRSVGGLVTGLSDYLNSMRDVSLADLPHLWVGWPGSTVSEKNIEEVTTVLRRDFNSYPVFISPSLMDNFITGFVTRLSGLFFIISRAMLLSTRNNGMPTKK